MTRAKAKDDVCWVCNNEQATLAGKVALPKGGPIAVCTKCHRIVVELLQPELFENKPKSDLPILHVGPDWRPQEGRMRSLSTAREVHLDVDHLQKKASRDILFMDLHGHKIGAVGGSKYKKKPHKQAVE